MQLEFLLVLRKFMEKEPSQSTGTEIPAMETPLHVSGKFSEVLFNNRHPFGLVFIEIPFLEKLF